MGNHARTVSVMKKRLPEKVPEKEKGKLKEKEGQGQVEKRQQPNRHKWIYINVLRERYGELERITETEGPRLDIVDAKELFRLILTQFIIKYKEAKDFELAVESTFIDMFPTLKHYDELVGILTKNFRAYVRELKREQGRRESRSHLDLGRLS